MTHDKTCKFDPKYCRDCKLQAEARADEREQAAIRLFRFMNDPEGNGTYTDEELYDVIRSA